MISKKLFLTLLLSFSVISPTLSAKKEGSPKHPNIILFLIDDLGWSDLGFTGSTFHETPHLDQLAKESTFFTQAYAANPVGTPTRASILTGQYPSRLKITNHTGSKEDQGPGYLRTPPEVAGHIPSDHTTLAEALKSAGYATAHIGKWHLAPQNQKSHQHHPKHNGFDLVDSKDDHTLTDKAIDFIRKQAPAADGGGQAHTAPAADGLEAKPTREGQAPFFLNLWYDTIHTATTPDQKLLSKYQEKAKALDPAPAPLRVAYYKSRPRQDNPDYAARIESMDTNIGRILKEIKTLGLENDTIILFLSDNGSLSTSVHGKAPTSSQPLKAGKAWLYEGGIRTPLLIKYPPLVKAAQKTKTPAISTDLFPTILDLVGLPLLPDQHLDGLSLKPILTGERKTLDRDALYFHYPHYNPLNCHGPTSAILSDNYKLIEIHESGRLELYDLNQDPGEEKNLVKESPHLARKLFQKLNTWKSQTNALPTTVNFDYRPEKDWRTKLSARK